jgi:predicted dehydrogenase
MAHVIRWGVIGTGNMAGQFARGLQHARGARLVAVASRSIDRARQFGRTFGVPHCYGVTDAVVEDPCVDVIYVATPPALHHECVMRCLEAGKPVLCEKPLAINADQARAMAAFARKRRLFLMEAMWTRFLPPLLEVRRLLQEGAIGRVTRLEADLGFDRRSNAASWLRDPGLGGGCLLDVGVYPLTLAAMALGTPLAIRGRASVCETGVDETNAIHLKYPGGAEALITADICAPSPLEAHIIGSAGRLHLHTDWWKGGPFSLTTAAGTREFDLPVLGNGYAHEAEEVSRCLFAGATESRIMPLSESILSLQIADHLRRQWGVKYPCEESAPGGSTASCVQEACP